NPCVGSVRAEIARAQHVSASYHNDGSLNREWTGAGDDVPGAGYDRTSRAKEYYPEKMTDSRASYLGRRPQKNSLYGVELDNRAHVVRFAAVDDSSGAIDEHCSQSCYLRLFANDDVPLSLGQKHNSIHHVTSRKLNPSVFH